MQEKYISLGLMSGTSADGVDASIIQSDGVSYFEVLKDKYYEYNSEIFKNIHSIKEKIQNINDLVKFKKEISDSKLIIKEMKTLWGEIWVNCINE